MKHLRFTAWLCSAAALVLLAVPAFAQQPDALPPEVRVDSNIHHIRLVHHRLGADVARHRLAVQRHHPAGKGIFQLGSDAFFAPRVGKANFFQCRDLRDMLRRHVRNSHFASYQLFPNFASAVSGTLRDATFSISRLTSAATSGAMVSGHSTISSS